ncbi:MAG: CopG family ribbon-helix-helix protein [Shewanella algae]
MSTLTIRIDDELAAELEHLARERQQSKSEVARQLLRGSLLREALRLSQERLGPAARASGWLTEDDVLQDVS